MPLLAMKRLARKPVWQGVIRAWQRSSRRDDNMRLKIFASAQFSEIGCQFLSWLRSPFFGSNVTTDRCHVAGNSPRSKSLFRTRGSNLLPRECLNITCRISYGMPSDPGLLCEDTRAKHCSRLSRVKGYMSVTRSVSVMPVQLGMYARRVAISRSCIGEAI
ncbi:hypothetical protein BX666DRAFT_2076266 [Dichotomocladium elegans]|nr:hypothetical protein BX666DRAFT_2076266 [Dichotomocladium elegans]